MKKFLMASVVMTVAALVGANAMASSWAQIETAGPGAATLDNASGAYPVVTAIGSAPGTVDGYTYTTYSFFSQDSSGAGDHFGVGSTGYTPTIGDAISTVGTFGPFHQIPEIASPTSITLQSSGNAVPSTNVFTIPTLIASGVGALPNNIAGYILQLQNVTLYTDPAATVPVSGNFATHANVTMYAKDGSGNIMEVFDWASSYSVCGAFGGTAIPTGPVNLTGFVSESSGFPPELTPFQYQAVPEPSTILLVGTGMLGLLTLRRRQRS
jgi:hypothetical protein